MSKTGLLTAVHLSSLSSSLAATRKYALSKLYVQVHPQFKDVTRCSAFSKLIASVYQNSPQVLGPGVDLRFLISTLKVNNYPALKENIDYLFFDYSLASYCGKHSIANLYPSAQLIELNTEAFSLDAENYKQSTNSYKNVVLGGTFDRFHNGHKVLLSQAVLLAEERLVVGVTDTNMIRNKTLWELILPEEQRIHEVRTFLQEIDSTLKYEVVPISDPFGPTATDPNMDMIVVSTETARGGAKVNEVRAKNGLNQLHVHTIELLDESANDEHKESKISSSNQRMDLLGTRLKPREPKPHLPTVPYIIGLTGGIASGKSKMAERFQKFGAGLVNCDIIAHQLYAPGEDCYQAVVNNFGLGIVNEDKTINRKALGAIVFADPEKLKLLNSILWDAILERTMQCAQQLHEKENKQIVVIEAAVLLQAGWQRACHEVWSCIVPKAEAIKRLVERNGLSEKDANQRVEAQTSNSELVNNSDVVFSTSWSYEFSQQQAERAWNTLVTELKLKL